MRGDIVNNNDSQGNCLFFHHRVEPPQNETWTDFDGPSWIQYDSFRKNKLTGSKKGKSGQVYASSG